MSLGLHCGVLLQVDAKILEHDYKQDKLTGTSINHLYPSLSPLKLIKLLWKEPWPNFCKDFYTHQQSTPSWLGCDEEMEPNAAALHHEALWGSWWPGHRCCVSPGVCHTPLCSAQRFPPTKSTMSGKRFQWRKPLKPLLWHVLLSGAISMWVLSCNHNMHWQIKTLFRFESLKCELN